MLTWHGVHAAQVGPWLCEEAPQELRSRMWMALLADPSLCGNLLEEKVLSQPLGQTQAGRKCTSEHGQERVREMIHVMHHEMAPCSRSASHVWCGHKRHLLILLPAQALEEELRSTGGGGGSARSARSTSFTSSRTGEVSPRGSAGATAAATNTLSHAGSSAGGMQRRSSDASHTLSAAEQDAHAGGAADEAAHGGGGGEAADQEGSQQQQQGSAGKGSRGGLEELGGRGWRRRAAGRLGSLTAASSEAGSADGGSLATERGSEAVLGDIGEEEPAQKPNQAAGPEEPVLVDVPTAGSGAEAGHASAAAERDPLHAQQHDSDAAAKAGSSSGEAGVQQAAGASRSARHPLDGQADEHAAQPSPQDHLSAVDQDHAEPPAAEQIEDAASGVHQLQPPSPAAGDVGHLPIARTPSDGRRGSQAGSEPGHLLAEHSQVG